MMPEWLSLSSPHVWFLVGFHLFIFFMLALDLGIFNRKAHVVGTKEAALWSITWISFAALFAGLIYYHWDWWNPQEPEAGTERSLEFVVGYLIELSLSVDNLFVFMVIFRYFGVPAQYQHRILFWGIVGALVMRATFILIGAALLENFHWMLYVFGALLLYTSYKMLRSSNEHVDPGKNPVLRFAKRIFPFVDSYDSAKFWVKRDGKWHSTPLLLVLLVVESTDVVFAIDSIPAIFGVTREPFIVYTSNIFAILGLRSLYFLLSGFLGMFRYLNIGLALVLGFVGLKMMVEGQLHGWLESVGIHKKEIIFISLGTIATILGSAILASILIKPKQTIEHLPEQVVVDPRDLPPGALEEAAKEEAG